MDFKSRDTAEKRGLIQHTVWLLDSPEEREFLQSRYNLITRDKHRICMFVKWGFQIALFCDDVTSVY